MIRKPAKQDDRKIDLFANKIKTVETVYLADSGMYEIAEAMIVAQDATGIRLRVGRYTITRTHETHAERCAMVARIRRQYGDERPAAGKR